MSFGALPFDQATQWLGAMGTLRISITNVDNLACPDE